MKIRKKIAEIKILRKIIFLILKRLNFEYGWKHDITLRRLYLETWLHKGYWYYGKHRESSEVEMFRKLINKGDCVFEIGGHIGYVTQIFEDLVGAEGNVLVAEPTPKSRYLLEKNVRDNTVVLPFAITDIDGETEFYTEEFGGYKNSSVRSFTETPNTPLSSSHQNYNKQIVSTITVESKTVDSICEHHSVSPSFLKIDVEGSELSVLKGAGQVLNNARALMVEVSNNHKEIFNFLKAYNFLAFDAEGVALGDIIKGHNIFFVKGS